MAQPIHGSIVEGTVDTGKEHIKIFYGDGMVPICLLQPQGDTFTVQLLVKDDEVNGPMLVQVCRELKLHLIDRRMPSTWRYVILHCSSGENMFSSVHWVHKPV